VQKSEEVFGSYLFYHETCTQNIYIMATKINRVQRLAIPRGVMSSAWFKNSKI